MSFFDFVCFRGLQFTHKILQEKDVVQNIFGFQINLKSGERTHWLNYV